MDPIKELLHLYADAVCRQDVDQWINTWSMSGVWDLGHGEPVSGKESLKPFWLSSMSRFETVVHTYSTNIADLDADSGTGSGRAYVTEWLKPKEGDSLVLHGFYDDSYVFEEGSWLFSKRVLNRIYMGKADFSS
ncbi:MAG: nuclear transport factor 2 family protein [Actinomycetota bacterium]|nr:nuclear transport factor 2 family protein [Actinomycetota bacterium]